MKLGFVHLMKTAGSSVNSYMKHKLLGQNLYWLEDPDKYGKTNWNREELLDFSATNKQRVYIHSHSGAWSADVIEEYVKQNWLLFSFYRHPGDQWCSFYYWARGKGEQFQSIAHQFELDDFLQRAWQTSDEHQGFCNLRRQLDLPSWWRSLNYVALFSRANFRQFIKRYFKRTVWTTPAKNRSKNQGYEYYRRKGIVSDATHQLLLDSQRYRDYQELAQRPHVREDQAFSDPARNFFLARRRRQPNDPTRFAILFQGRSGSSWLTAHLDAHPQINAFPECLDSFEHRRDYQRKWLDEFYYRLPNKNPAIRCLGFKTKLSSIVHPPDFKEFFEREQVKVIHLYRANPVHLAISIVRANRLRNATGRSNLYDASNRLGPVEISVDEFKSALGRSRKYQELQEFVDLLEVPKISIEYEELRNDFKNCLKRIHRFLGVVHVLTEADIWKNTPTDLSQAVSNLNELQAAFPALSDYFR